MYYLFLNADKHVRVRNSNAMHYESKLMTQNLSQIILPLISFSAIHCPAGAKYCQSCHN